jgi:site-specific DNA recombinase
MDSPEKKWRVTVVYREEGRSAKDTNRPEYQRMLLDVAGGKINAVLCTSTDRMNREPRDFEDLQTSLRKQGVLFFSLNQNWDMTTPEGELLTGQQMLNNRYERRKISERVKEKCAWRSQQGMTNGGPQMLGYDPNPEQAGVPIVNEEEGSLVLFIFSSENTFASKECARPPRSSTGRAIEQNLTLPVGESTTAGYHSLTPPCAGY